jgi:hypothetical protein
MLMSWAELQNWRVSVNCREAWMRSQLSIIITYS